MASQSLTHEEPDLRETQLQIQHGTATPLVTPDHAVAMAERGVLIACTGDFVEQHILTRAKRGISSEPELLQSGLLFSGFLFTSFKFIFLLLYLLCNYV